MFESEIGVKQGDNMSLTCFSQYINGLIKRIESLECGVKCGTLMVSCLAYADDLVLLAESEENLQRMLDAMNKWCYQWRVVINMEKTNIVHFRRRNVRQTMFEFHIGNKKLAISEKYRYLGLVLGQYPDSNCTVEHLSGSGSCALGGIISKTRENYDLGYLSYMKLFNSCVAPVLDYGSGAWCVGGKIDCTAIDRVQLRATRFYMGLPRTSATLGVIGDISWTPGVIRRDLEVLRLYNQIVNMPSSQLTRKIMNYDIACNAPKSWSNNVKTLCSSIGCSEEWETLNPINIKHAKVRLSEMYDGAWVNGLMEKTKLSLYKELKSGISVMSHLTINLRKDKRAFVSQLRCGNLPTAGGGRETSKIGT